MTVDKIDVCAEMREKFDLHDMDPASLENSDLVAMQSHFERCEGCKSWLSTWEIVKMSAKHIADRPVPAGLAQKVMAQLDAQPVTSSYYREITFAVGCMIVFLVFQAGLASETMPEILAWCASFAMLLLAQRLFSAMRQQVVA
jgi:hypothetical protein